MKETDSSKQQAASTKQKESKSSPLTAYFLLLKRFWQRSLWNKFVTILLAAVLLLSGTMYGVGQWYIALHKDEPLRLGVTFIPSHAESLGLDAEQTMDTLINDLGVRHFRLVSYWDQLEPEPGVYNFDLLDWQFAKAEAAGATVTLALGLRQPRWPECHWPEWAKQLPSGFNGGTWQTKLEAFMTEVIKRYKASPALESYQLENEFFLTTFSPFCTDYSRERLINEFDLIKRLDPIHSVMMSRSNNYGLALGQPRPDIYSFSVYRRIWDAKTDRYFQYPLPTWWYAGLAGWQQLLTGRQSNLHELQTEPWPPNGLSTENISLEEQSKSFDAKRFKDSVEFAKATGLREIYLWGAEYWLYRKDILHDPSVWQVARNVFNQKRQN